MTGKYKLVACDIDGTLLGSDMKLSEENINAISELSQKGIYFVPATGRSLSEISDVKNIDGIRYIIYSNGAAILDKATGKTEFIGLNGSEAKTVLDTVTRYPCYIVEHCDGKTCVGEKGEAVYERNNVSIPVRHLIDDMAEYVEDFERRMYTMENLENINVFFASEADMRECKAKLSENPGLLCVEGWKCNLEIFSAKAGKGNALSMLTERLSVSLGETVAIGDSGNDLPIIKAAGLGLCVSNGCKALKEAADEIICSNDEHVVSYVLNRYF